MEYAGYRVLIKRFVSGSYQTIAQVEDISGPDSSREEIDVSHRADGQPQNQVKRFVTGQLDNGELTFGIIFDPDDPTHDPTLGTSLYASFINGETEDFQLEFPGEDSARTTATFDVIVTGWSTDAPLADGLTAEVTTRLTGPITWAHVP